MKLSRSVTYAVEAALQLAQNPSRVPIPCSRMAAQGQMPERFLLQILRSLVTHGILRSSGGAKGGYTLDRDPHDISLLEMMEAVDGPITTVLSLGEHLEYACRETLTEALHAITVQTRNQLRAIRLSALLPAPAPTNGHIPTTTPEPVGAYMVSAK